MRTVSVRIPVYLDEQLTRISRQRRVSRSTILREAIGEYLAESDNSFSQQASHLAGSLYGPENLSTSAEYLAEYGQ